MSDTTKIGAVVHATEDNFSAVVLQAQLPVLVKFGADWCPPCRMMEPYLELFARHYANRAVIVEVNRDHAPNLAKTYGVGGIPHLIVFDKGAVVPVPEGEDKFDGIGLPDYPMLRDWVSEMLTGAVAAPTPAETAFAQAAEAAAEARDKSISQSQASQDFNAVWEPHGSAYAAAIESAKTALEAKSIDQSEHDRLVGAAREANKTAFQSATIQAAYAAYKTVSDTAEAACKTAILAAIDQCFPAPATESTASAAPADKGFCAIGDKTCTG